jgi:N-acetylmuramoyl-L-alanine amidase-like protein
MVSRRQRFARKAAWLAGPGVAVGLLWLVAPALSLDRYAAEPVNFEQRVPAAAKLSAREARRAPAAARATVGAEFPSDEGRVRYLTDPIAAPKRFDLVGLVDQDRPVEIRAREAGGEWTPWVETTDGEPIWTGGTDELQIRSRDARPHGEIGYVNVSGDATAEDRLLNGVRGAVNSAFLSVASVVAPGDAGADPPFEVVNRAEWDPNGSCKPRTPVNGEVRATVIHHTVNANTYTPEEAPGIVLGICRYHRYSHGWNDIGYNALVDRYGNIYAGRAGGLGSPIVGAHTGGFNSQTVGLSSIGTHTVTGMTREALGAAVRFLTWKLPLHGVDAAGKARIVSAGGSGNRYPAGRRVSVPEVTRHRRLNQTSCPGRAQVSKIAKRTQRRIAAGGATTTEPPPAGGVLP